MIALENLPFSIGELSVHPARRLENICYLTRKNLLEPAAV
jgi:hypothetical protein